MWDCVQVKEEAAWEVVSAEAAAAELYAGHEVKRELVVGPDVLQPPDAAFGLKPNFEVTVVKEELNEEESDVTWNYNGDSKQVKDYIKETYNFSHSLKQPVLRSCFVRLERIILDKEQQFNNNANFKHKILDFKPNDDEKTYHNIEDSDKITLRKKTKACSQKVLFICDTCGLLFAVRKKIIRHLQTCSKQVHKTKFNKRTKLLSCKTCNTQFKKRVDLTKHERMHTREKLHKCEVCEKRFYQSSHLFRHKRTHRRKPPVKETHLCEICDKQFTSKYDLAIHLRVHTGQMPYVCQCCGKRFNKKSTLVKHEQIHAEKRPYSCEVCHTQFAVKWNLTRHKRRHANEYPYTCGLCAKKYMHSYSLTKHKRKKHP